MRYFSTFITGFGDVVRDVLPTTIPGVEIEQLLDGAVVYTADHSQNEIVGVPYFNNTFQVLHHFKQIEEGALPGMMKFIYNSNWLKKNLLPTVKGARAFRVVASCKNEIGTVDLNIVKNTESAIAKETGLILDRGKPDVEYWFIARSEGVGFFLMRLTYKKNEKKLEPGELRSELACLLCLISEPHRNDMFLDPFAGSGAIARARKELPHKKILSSDIKEGVDATKLIHIQDASIDKIVTDPPWGLAEEADVETLYRQTFKEFERLLKSGGIIVLLTSRKLLMEKMLPEFPKFELEKKLNVLVNGKKAGVFKIRKVAS